jgi:hypothetical protein
MLYNFCHLTFIQKIYLLNPTLNKSKNLNQCLFINTYEYYLMPHKFTQFVEIIAHHLFYWLLFGLDKLMRINLLQTAKNSALLFQYHHV